MIAAEVIAALGGRGSTAKCPAHDDSTPSLSVSDGEHGVLVHCHAGCEQQAVLDTLAARGIELRRDNGHAPFDVTTFALAKGLPLDLLCANYVSDVELDRGEKAVGFEYRDRGGQVTGLKFRRALRGERGFFWRKGSRMCLYGLWRLEDMRTVDQRIVIVEGESDALTLWAHEFTALGLPGASMWREEWLADLPDDDSPVYVVVEPDRGGQTVQNSLANSKLRDRAHLVRMPVEHKDPSALFLSDPQRFTKSFDELLASARPWSDGAEKPNPIVIRQAAEIVDKPVSANWLLRPYLEELVLAILFGELGSLKSFVVLDMLLAIAAGKPWADSSYRRPPKPVIYITAEGKGLRKRLRAWALHHRIDLAEIPFYAIEHPVDMSNAETVAWLIAAIEKLGITPAAIGIDTLSRNSGPLDENSTADMQTLLNMLDARLRIPLGCTVLLVHHVGHGAKDRGRGSYVLMGNTDAFYLVERPDRDALTVRITTGRLKDSESPEPLYLKAQVVDLGTADEDGKPETSLVLVPTDERPVEPRRQPTGKNQKRLLDALETSYQNGQLAWSTTEIRRLAKAQLGMPASSAKSAQIGLVESGFLKSTMGGLALSDPPDERLTD